jgi:hypothetical protein
MAWGPTYKERTLFVLNAPGSAISLATMLFELWIDPKLSHPWMEGMDLYEVRWWNHS